MTNYLAFITSITLAVIAAFFSIIGLSTIFAGAFWSVVIMASALEVGKLVTAAWLHLEWKRISIPIKSYLTLAVVVLMFITSMGIFGYLSKAHLEQETKTSNNSVKLENVQRKLSSETRRLDAIDKQLGSLDAALDEYIERGYITRGLKAREEQKTERTQLESSREEISQTIDKLQEEELELKRENIAFELEIGAIKYIAELIYGDEAQNYYDKAVRGVILSLVFVFDPLAVVLLIASTKAIATRREETPTTVKTKEVLILDDIKETPVETIQEETVQEVSVSEPTPKPKFSAKQLKRPKWVKDAIATTRGYVSKSGELLDSRKMTQEQADLINEIYEKNKK